MTIDEALAIVLDLAEQNLLDDEEIFGERETQEEALNKIHMFRMELNAKNKNKKVVNFPFDHINPKHSQVFIALTGEPEAIRARLNQIVDNFSEYGKPIQGTVCKYRCTGTVITPIWEGKEY